MLSITFFQLPQPGPWKILDRQASVHLSQHWWRFWRRGKSTYLSRKGKKTLQMKEIFSHKQCQRRKENYINFLWMRFGPKAKLFDYLSVVHHVGCGPSTAIREKGVCVWLCREQVSIDSLPQHWVRLSSSILLIIDEGWWVNWCAYWRFQK